MEAMGALGRQRGRRRTSRTVFLAAAPLVAVLAAGCSPKGLAISVLARSLAESGEVFASDADPELIRDATPFALKTTEALLAEKPRHEGLLLAACRGFAGYSWAFVELDAERLEATDFLAAEALYDRARGLYLRARDYCLRGLEGRRQGISERLALEPHAAVAGLGADAVPLLYWTGASWGAAIAISLDRPEITADLEAVRALIGRAVELEPGYGEGALQEAALSLASLPAAMGGSPEAARRHFEAAVSHSGGNVAGPYVALAEKVMIQEQDRDGFVELLERALAVDPDAAPSRRLENVLAQRRARWLLGRVDELFL